MGYTDHDWFEADATGAFPVFGRPDADGVRYADSGLLPDDVLPADEGWFPADGAQAPDGALLSGSARASHVSQAGTRVAHGYEIAHESPLTDAGRHGSGLTVGDRFAESGGDAEGSASDAFPPVGAYSGEGFPAAGQDVAGDTGDYPMDDWYAGYEQYAGEEDDRPGQRRTAAEEETLVRTYARPADPREAAGFAGQPSVTGQPPAAGQPTGDRLDGGHQDGGYQDELSLADYADRSSLAGRIVRLRPDRWLIAGGGLAAATAVVVAFVMAGGSGSAAMPGSAARPGSGTAQTATMQSAAAHASPPVCVTPAPGR
jgi:hypothetical protein